MDLKTAVSMIRPLDEAAMEKAWAVWDNKVHPLKKSRASSVDGRAACGHGADTLSDTREKGGCCDGCR